MSHTQMKAIVQQKVVENGRTVTKNLLKPFHQVSNRKLFHLNTIETISLNDWPSNTTLNSNSRIRTMIPRGSFPGGHCSHLSLRFDVTMNGASATLTDVFHWFSKIEIRAGGTSELLQTLYNDTMLFQYLLNVNEQQLKHSAETLCMDRKFVVGGRSTAMAQNETRTFYLPLVNSIFSSDLEYDKLDQDIIMEFTVSSGSPVISGAGSITCSAFVVIEGRENHPMQKDAKHSMGPDVIHSNTYLDVVKIDKFNTTLTSNGQFLFPTDSVVGSSPFILLNTAPAGTNENAKWFNSQDFIGDNGLVNFLSPNNEGILSNSHIRADFLRQEYMTKNMKHNILQDKKGYMIIPFSDNLQGASSGIHSGCYNFTQQKNNIMLQPAGNRQNQVITLNTGNVLTSGNYIIRVGNEYTVPLAYNASVSAVKTALENLKVSQSYGITWTMSASLSSSASVTLTVASGGYVFADGEISVEGAFFTGSAVPGSCVVSTTTQYVGGANGTVDICAYVFVYKNIFQNKNKLTSALDSY